jgi:spore coat protein U-like protein
VTLTAVVVLCLSAPSIATAGTGTLNVVSSVTVISICTYAGTPALAFASYDPVVANASTPATGTGILSITCPDTLAYSVTANLGLNAAAASGACATGTCTRAMSSSGNFLAYDIYTTPAHATVWNAANGIAATGTGVAQSVNVFGYIPAAQVAPSGTYADTVTVTVTF